jgi:hypothetical protein
MLTGQRSYAEIYREARRARAAAYVRLLPFSVALGQPIAGDAVELGDILERSDSLLAGVIDGGIPVGRFIDQLPERQAAFTRAIGAVTQLDRRISRLMTDRRT